MQYREKNVALKDGTNCLIKSVPAKDAAAIIAQMRLTSEETDYMSRYADEVTMTEDEERAFLDDFLAAPDRVMLGAYIAGELIGSASIAPVAERDRMRHRGGFGMSVQRACWRLGVGTELLAAIIDCARKIGFEIVELDVVLENERAIKLYERFGFKTLYEHERFFKYRDGSYASSLIMELRL